MNKKKYIQEISNKLNVDYEYATKIEDCLEENPLIGIKNKEKILSRLIEKLNIDEEEANRIYNVSVEIAASAIKNKIKHPFKDLD